MICSSYPNRLTSPTVGRNPAALKHPSCPKCRSDLTDYVAQASSAAKGDCYRCAECGNVWSVPRDRAKLPLPRNLLSTAEVPHVKSRCTLDDRCL
jgi:tRNA(Ile2) C34 agmatinyltransferase TiaS